MASRTRRAARLALAVLAVALVGLGVWAWEPMWWWASSTPIYLEDGYQHHPVRAVLYEGRWSPRMHASGYYEGSGYKAYETFSDRWGRGPQTFWRRDGTVERQFETEVQGQSRYAINERNTPPWLWGVTDEPAPTMPAWIKDDAKWQAVLDAQE